MGYCQFEDGRVVDDVTIAATFRHARSIFIHIMVLGEPVASYGQFNNVSRAYYIAEMRSECPWLALCDDGKWKAEKVATQIYPGWIRALREKEARIQAGALGKETVHPDVDMQLGVSSSGTKRAVSPGPSSLQSAAPMPASKRQRLTERGHALRDRLSQTPVHITPSTQAASPLPSEYLESLIARNAQAGRANLTSFLPPGFPSPLAISSGPPPTSSEFTTMSRPTDPAQEARALPTSPQTGPTSPSHSLACTPTLSTTSAGLAQEAQAPPSTTNTRPTSTSHPPAGAPTLSTTEASLTQEGQEPPSATGSEAISVSPTSVQSGGLGKVQPVSSMGLKVRLRPVAGASLTKGCATSSNLPNSHAENDPFALRKAANFEITNPL